MQYYTYILKSKIQDRYYIGSSSDLDRRLRMHNDGQSRSTKAFIPWEIVYVEEYTSKSEAIKRENHLKKMKSKKYIEWLINNHSRGRPACPDPISD